MASNNTDITKAADLGPVLTAEDKADLFNALKNKLMNIADVDEIETLSPIVRRRVDALREIQGEHDELEAKFFEERAALEDKYEKLYQPLYTKRYEIVNGIVEVEENKTASEPTKESEGKDTEEKGVPEFWLRALRNNVVLDEEISERDEGALKFLKDIKWFRTEEPKGFKLEFHFDTNPYFKNSVLTKTYHVIDENEPILEKAIGTVIEWYPGKNLTQKVLKKKPKKGSKNTKATTKIEQCESFFNFFSPPQIPEDEEDMDEEAAEDLQNTLEQDYDIGSTIRDQIIGHAVSWYTGEAVEEYDIEVDDDEEDDDEEDEDDEEEEDDEVEKDGDTLIKEKSETAPTGEKPADCKQQ